MRTIDIVNGINILLKYYEKQDGYHSGSDHDEFYMYPTIQPLTPDDLQKMIALGWIQVYQGRDYSRDFSAQDYIPTESWIAYT